MQPHLTGQYNDILARDTYLVAVMKELDYITFDWWISWAKLHKANFILQFSSQSFLSKFYFLKGRYTPKYYIVASYVALGANQQNWNNQVPPPPCRMRGHELLT
jgi:hypothetical protein